MKKPLLVFTAVLCIALLGWPFLSAWVSPPSFWLVTILLAVVLAWASRSTPGRRLGFDDAADSDFLCDSCKFNDARYCSRRERPNATSCPDYKR